MLKFTVYRSIVRRIKWQYSDFLPAGMAQFIILKKKLSFALYLIDPDLSDA